MFEYKGVEYSREQLVDAANRYNNGDFEGYLEDMKNKGLVEKQAGSTGDPTMSQRSMGSDLETGFSEPVSWFDQTWFGRGIKAASTTGEATNLMSENFSNISSESIQDFIKAKEQEASTYVESERMKKFQKKYKEEGSTWSAFFRGVREQPGLLPELFVQSLGTQVGTLIDSPGASIAAAGTGAASGAAVGAIPGAVAGFMGGLATSMEAALTFGELIETRLKEKNQEFTDENIRALLESEGREIRNKALGRGLAIGTIEGLSGGLAGKAAVATKGVVKGARKGVVGAGAAGVGVEAVGGAAGEIAGRAVAGQEMDAAEIGFEAITGTVTAPVNVSAALLTAKQPTYRLNGESVTYEQMKDFVDTADDMDVAKADIKMENDFTGIGKKAQAKQEAAIEGIKLSGDEATIAEVADARAEIKFQDNMEFAKKHSKLYGLKFTELTQEEIQERFKDTKNSELSESLGGVIGDEIIINKDLAKTKVFGDNVGNHELLHGIIKASKANITQDTINDFLNIIGKENEAIIQKRIDDNYDADYMSKNLDEYFTIFSDAIANGDVKFNDSMFTKIQDVIRRMFASIGIANVDFENARGAYNFLKDYNKSIHKGTLSKGLKKATTGTAVFEDAVFSKAPETLIKTIKRGKNAKKVKAAEDALVPQYQALALEALGYTEKKGDIRRENVVSAINEYYEAIVRNYDPKKGAFSTHVYNNIAPKNDTIFEKAKTLAIREGVKLDAPEVKELAGDVGVTTNLEDTFVQKINILKDFAITDNIASKIKALIKVAEGDTFKQVISKYAGKVGELVFGIPAKKIMDSKANLIPTTKYKEGMPIPAEAQNIQRFFQAGENMSKFIKSLPLYNVADKTADIDKIGENIETPRNVFGVAIGLKGLPLDYFYENYTDPKAFSKDPKIYEQRITSKSGRSRGVSTQTQVKRLKAEFRNPTTETIEKAKRDIGITPRNESNIYNRDIGQLQKGFAKVYSINASLSGAQRFLADKLKKAPAEKKPAIKKQIASVTAAQGKAAFSKSIENVEQIISINDIFQLETKGIDGVLKFFKINKSYNIKTEEGRKKFLKAIETKLLPLLPKEFWMSQSGIDVFTGSNANYGLSMSETYKGSGVYKNPTEAKAYNKFRKDVRALIKNHKNFGKPINNANWNIDKIYTTVFGNKNTYKTKLKDTKRIKKWNKDIALIHKEMWSRFNEAIKNDETGELAGIIGTYLKLTANDKKSWHRLGAQIAGYSKEISKRKKGEANIEFEHAMPATAAYLYLMDSILRDGVDFNTAYDLVIDNYKLIVLDKAMDDKLTSAKTAKGYSLQKRMPDDWSLIENKWWERYFNNIVNNVDGGIDPSSIINLDGKTFAETFNIKKPITKPNLNKTKTLNKAGKFSRSSQNEPKGITVLDFDDTLATTKSLVKFTTPEGETGTLNAEEYASTYEDLQDKGYTFDFSDFNKVVKGKLAPLFNKAIKLQGKFGPENMFVLTARPPAAQKAIFDFLKANGLNIPIKNITGLGNSTAEAKALWIADKVGEGFNDFYFADDALQNVQAVKNMLDQFDVKSKVQQAKVKFSKSMNENFNDILEEVTGIDTKKRFSDIKARKRGASKGKFRFFIPPSHEDFVGLLYNFMGKGRRGDQHRNFFEQALVRPLNRAYREIDTAKQAIANDYKELNKQFGDVKKKLTKKTPDGDFTFEDAIRVYLWNKHGYDIPGLSPTDQTNLSELVMSDPQLQAYAETLNVISKQDTYVDPGKGWEGGNIKTDLIDATGRVGRAEYFAEFNENVDILFSEENLNKIEAGYGKDFRSALEDMLHRIKTGVNRPKGQSGTINKFMNYLNGSVGTVMFFNVRSAILQQMSIVNYINFADNNMFAAAKAFANQKQYWKDFAFIFNSDMLKQRRGGIGTDINGADLAQAVAGSKNPTKIVISKLLKLGFLPTQIGDNIAIATGGATFYRNRINKYIKDGLSQKEAEAKAFTDFQDLTQSTQQSSRPDMSSQQQASWIGKLVLNFQNITSQYNRIIKKAASDIYNRRITPPYTTQAQSDLGNLSKILYYGGIQNVIFYGLQTALFAVMFDDDKDEDQILKKRERVINGSIDSILRGSGIYGAVISTLKNTLIKFKEQREKGYNKDESAVLMELLNFSPVVGIKARQIVNAEKTINYNENVMSEMRTFEADNPQWSAVTNYTQALTNFPANRLYQKSINMRNALDKDYTNFQRVMFFSGYTTWSLGLGDNERIIEAKEKAKINKKNKKKSTRTRTKTRTRTRTR